MQTVEVFQHSYLCDNSLYSSYLNLSSSQELSFCLGTTNDQHGTKTNSKGVIVAPYPGNTSGDSLRPTQREGNHAWCWTPSQRLRAGEVMDLAGEPTAAISLNQHSPTLQSKHLSLCPQIRVVLIFATGGNHYRKPSPVKMRRGGAQPQWRGQTDCRNQRS